MDLALWLIGISLGLYFIYVELMNWFSKTERFVCLKTKGNMSSGILSGLISGFLVVTIANPSNLWKLPSEWILFILIIITLIVMTEKK